LVGTLILISSQILYLGIALYSPSTALEAAVGFPVELTIVISGVVAIIYTALGGMKASVWASTFQTFVMAAGVLMVVIKGCVDVGGFTEMWELNKAGGRVKLQEWEGWFDPNPLTRHTFWTLIVGGTIGWTSTYGVNQASVQRYSAMSTLSKARAVVLLNIPGLIFFEIICTLSGMVIYAYYASVKCDPLAAGYVSNSNQLIAYYVMDRMNYPCVPGLFLACLFAGALSSVSASLAALSTVTWKDFMAPYSPFKNMSNTMQELTCKILIVIYGCVGIGMAFMSAELGGTVLQASLSFTGAAGGPLLGLFILGAIFPCANAWGGVIGGIVGLVVPLWISIGAYEMEITEPNLNTTVEMCISINETRNNTATGPVTRPSDIEGWEQVYLISYLWYPAIGVILVVVVGLFVSAITGCLNPSDIPTKYLIPLFDRCCCCLPKRTRRILKCNLPFKSPEEILKETEAEALDDNTTAENPYQTAYDNRAVELSGSDLETNKNNGCEKPPSYPGPSPEKPDNNVYEDMGDKQDETTTAF